MFKVFTLGFVLAQIGRILPGICTQNIPHDDSTSRPIYGCSYHGMSTVLRRFNRMGYFATFQAVLSSVANR